MPTNATFLGMLHLYTMYTMVQVPFVVCTCFKDGLEQWKDVLIGVSMTRRLQQPYINLFCPEEPKPSKWQVCHPLELYRYMA